MENWLPNRKSIDFDRLTLNLSLLFPELFVFAMLNLYQTPALSTLQIYPNLAL